MQLGVFKKIIKIVNVVNLSVTLGKCPLGPWSHCVDTFFFEFCFDFKIDLLCSVCFCWTLMDEKKIH